MHLFNIIKINHLNTKNFLTLYNPNQLQQHIRTILKLILTVLVEPKMDLGEKHKNYFWGTGEISSQYVTKPKRISLKRVFCK